MRFFLAIVLLLAASHVSAVGRGPGGACDTNDDVRDGMTRLCRLRTGSTIRNSYDGLRVPISSIAKQEYVIGEVYKFPGTKGLDCNCTMFARTRDLDVLRKEAPEKAKDDKVKEKKEKEQKEKEEKERESQAAQPSRTRSPVAPSSVPSATASVSVTSAASRTRAASASASISVTSAASHTSGASASASISLTSAASPTSAASETASISLTSAASPTSAASESASISLSPAASPSSAPSESASPSTAPSDSASVSLSLAASPSPAKSCLPLASRPPSIFGCGVYTLTGATNPAYNGGYVRQDGCPGQTGSGGGGIFNDPNGGLDKRDFHRRDSRCDIRAWPWSNGSKCMWAEKIEGNCADLQWYLSAECGSETGLFAKCLAGIDPNQCGWVPVVAQPAPLTFTCNPVELDKRSAE